MFEKWKNKHQVAGVQMFGGCIQESQRIIVIEYRSECLYE